MSSPVPRRDACPAVQTIRPGFTLNSAPRLPRACSALIGRFPFSASLTWLRWPKTGTGGCAVWPDISSRCLGFWAGARPAKSAFVRRAVLEQVGPFTLGNVVLQASAASPRLIKKVLAQLKSEVRIRLHGRGRGPIGERTTRG